MATPTEMKTKIAKLPVNLDRMDGIVNGPATGPTSLVTVDSGQVKTLARVVMEGAADAGTRAAIDGDNVSPYAADWRNALGLGDAATRDVGLGAGTVAAGDDRRLRAFPVNNRIAFLGDSITAQGISNDANNIRNNNRGMTFWVPFLTRQRFVSPQSLNFGIIGQTSAEIAARVGDVVASGAGSCVVLAGTNDLGTNDFAATTASLASIYKALSDANIMIVSLPILPRTIGADANAEQNWGFINRVNSWIAKQGQVYPGYRFVDPRFLFGDPYSLDLSPRTGFTYDGLHPVAIGMRYISKPIAEYLNTMLPDTSIQVSSPTDYFSAYNPGGTLNNNPMLAGSAGTLGPRATGAVANDWAIGAYDGGGGAITSLNVAASKVTVNNLDAQRILISGTATGGYQTIVVFEQTFSPTNLKSGDTIEAICDFQTAGGVVGVSGIATYVMVTQNGVDKFSWDGHAVVSDDLSAEAIAGVSRTPAMTLTHDATQARCGVWVFLKNTGSERAASIDISSFAIRKV